jgi:hypothetical protein
MPALPFEPLPPVLTPEIIHRRIESMVRIIGEVYDQFMALAVHYGKPVIICSELPFAIGDLEERMVQMLGAKGYVCYPRPEDGALVMVHLFRYARHLRGR